MGEAIEFTFSVEPIDEDTGGAYRIVNPVIVIDSSTPKHVQLHSAFYEVLGAYLDPTEHAREKILEIADTLLEAHRCICAESEPT